MPAPSGGRGGVAGDRLSAAQPAAWDHLVLLNEASARIGTTLDLQRTAQEFADFTVPRIADGCAVDLLDSLLHGEEGARWTGSRPPVLRAMAVAQIPQLGNLEPDPVGEIATSDPTLVGMQCLMAREPVLISQIRPDEYERIAVTRSAAVQMRKAGVHSYMVVPLIARGVLLGLADFVRSADRPPFTYTDLALTVQLASKAAVFFDNARLYGRERDHVVTLQRSLLPRTTPPTPGLDVSTCYAPSSDPGGVGGDWFDVVALPGGRTALVVGDVMSHGLPAAATMGRLRSVARTLMALDIAPERVLARLDLAARDLEEDQIATCLCVVHDPFDGDYTVARAGHPPPLLVAADGTARYLDVPAGAPLGAGVIPYDSVRVPVEPGSRLVLFTDGVIKTRTDDIDTQLQRLLDAAASPRTRDLDADGLIGFCLPPAPRFDEAVMVVARSGSPGAAPDVGEWRLPDDGSAAGAARRLVRERLEHWRLTDLADVTELVVSELVGNALRYGCGPGHLRLLRHERLVVEVSDTGPDLPQIQHPTLSDEGGRGLQLINMLCRRWGSCRTPAGKVVWAEQDIPGTGRPVS
jgi:hypothetical protein